MYKNKTIIVSENGIFTFTGNCVELAARGTLNQIPCKETFSSGCPDAVFNSLELYKCTFHLSIYYHHNTDNFHLSAEIIMIY